MRPTTSPNFSWLDLARLLHRVEHGNRGGEREGELLHRRRARLLQVIRADVHRIPLRQLAGRKDRDVLDQPHRRRRRKHIGAARQILLDDVVLDRAGQRRARRVLLVGDRDIERHQPRRGGVDGHRGVHRRERDAVEQRAHVAEMRDRHADLADLAARQHVVGVVAGLGRQIERDRKAGLALGEVFPIERVRTRAPSNGPRRCGKSKACRAFQTARFAGAWPPDDPAFCNANSRIRLGKRLCVRPYFTPLT